MLEIKNLTVKYGDNVVIDNFSCDLSNYKIIALCGKSGCGKTTLLNVIAGLLKQTSGEVVTDLCCSYMFQQPRLFNHLTALENVNVVLSDKKDTVDFSKEVLRKVDFYDFDKKTDELSGGMKQRVSLARTLAYDADLLILDEPLSALDSESREKLLDIIKNDGRQVIFVTHNDSDTRIADYVINM